MNMRRYAAMGSMALTISACDDASTRAEWDPNLVNFAKGLRASLVVSESGIGNLRIGDVMDPKALQSAFAGADVHEVLSGKQVNVTWQSKLIAELFLDDQRKLTGFRCLVPACSESGLAVGEDYSRLKARTASIACALTDGRMLCRDGSKHVHYELAATAGSIDKTNIAGLEWR